MSHITLDIRPQPLNLISSFESFFPSIRQDLPQFIPVKFNGFLESLIPKVCSKKLQCLNWPSVSQTLIPDDDDKDELPSLEWNSDSSFRRLKEKILFYRLKNLRIDSEVNASDILQKVQSWIKLCEFDEEKEISLLKGLNQLWKIAHSANPRFLNALSQYVLLVVRTRAEQMIFDLEHEHFFKQD
jgi:hypothetical protein